MLLPLLNGTREPLSYNPSPTLLATHDSFIVIGSAATQCVARGGSAVRLKEGGAVAGGLATIPRGKSTH